MKIRDAHINDLPEMTEIYNDAVRNLAASFDIEEQTLEERREWFLGHGNRYPIIVAEEQERVLGYCSLSKYRKKPAYIHSAELSIYISKDYRGKGVGSRLMKEMIERTQSLGYHTLVSGITDGNAGSIALHQKFGFSYVGCFREVGFKFNQWHDVHFYQRLLENVSDTAE
ncbi:N-acetyltransferase family protein [Sporolactobacillus sp. THM7-7]|nr:N-acetyltransferase family protein [Sporolactobacillus sp. THM7-7]